MGALTWEIVLQYAIPVILSLIAAKYHTGGTAIPLVSPILNAVGIPGKAISTGHPVMDAIRGLMTHSNPDAVLPAISALLATKPSTVDPALVAAVLKALDPNGGKS